MPKFLCALIVLTCCFDPCFGQGAFQHTVTYVAEAEGNPRERELDIQRMSVDVSFDTKASLVKGKVTHVFKVLRRNLDSVRFDAIRISIKQLTVSGKPARFRSDDTSVVVFFEPALSWDQIDSMTISYEATPRKGLYFVGWHDTTEGRQKQIWTQGQPIDNRHWIPMYDELNDKMLTETTITFDSNYAVVSNGERRSVVSNSDGTKTWRYGMNKPHANYLLMIAVGDYAITEKKSKGGVPIELYSYPKRPEQVEPTYRGMEQIFSFLEDAIGYKYPWSVYRQVPVADYIFGAMENTTATVLGDFYLTDARERLDRNYQSVNIHELAHQWFGDLITARDVKHLWLHESFATFYPVLYTQKYDGIDAYQWSLRGMQNGVIAAGEKDQLPVVHTRSGGSRIYAKGACILDMMRFTFGEEEMKRVINHYLQHHAFNVVETNDLLLAFQDTLGLSPTWFFDQWLYRGGEPHFEVSYTNADVSTTEGARSQTIVLVSQIQPTDQLTGYFRVITNIEVHYDDGSTDSARATLDGPHSTITIPNKNRKRVEFVLFDPGSRILKKVTFKKSVPELLAQVKKAPFMIDRFDAFVALASDSNNDTETFRVGSGLIDDEKFFALRAEAIKFMVRQGYAGKQSAWDVVAKGLADSHVEVRKAALYSLQTVPETLRENVEELLFDSSYHVIQNALTRLCRSFPEHTAEYCSIVKSERSPGALVEIAAAEVLAQTGNRSSAESLARYAGPAFEFQTRQNALKALKRMSLVNETAAKNIADAACSANERLAATAFETLDYLWEQNSWRAPLRAALKTQVIPVEKRSRVEKFLN